MSFTENVTGSRLSDSQNDGEVMRYAIILIRILVGRNKAALSFFKLYMAFH